MIDLKEVITKYPECLENAAKLKAYLGDLYPAEKARINVLTALMSIGAAEEIRNTERLDKLVVSNYCSRLLNEYGYSEALSAECVELWHTTYVKRQEVQASPQIVPAAKTHGFYAKVAGVTFEGRQSFIAEMHRKGSTALTLERDRNNPYDVNAVAVINEYGWQIGWLPKDIASQIAPQMDAGIQVTAKVSAINIGEAGYNSGVSIYIEVGEETKIESTVRRKTETPQNEFAIEKIEDSTVEDEAIEEYWSEYFEELRRWDKEYWQYIFDSSDGSIDYTGIQFQDESLDELEGFSVFESIDEYFEHLGYRDSEQCDND